MQSRRDLSPPSPVHTSPRDDRGRDSDRGGIVSPGETLFGTPSSTRTLAHSSPDLPPLPAFPISGALPSTPPRTSNDDKKYFTASWGSPYQAPDPSSGRRGIAPGNWTANSDDLDDESSPNLRFGLSHLIPSRLPTFQVTPTRPSTPSSGVVTDQTPRSLNFAPSIFTKRPARVTSLVPVREHSPFEEEPDLWVQQGNEESIPSSPPSDPLARYQRHKSRDSNLTLTPEDFWEIGPIGNQVGNMHKSRWANPDSSSAPKSMGSSEPKRQDTMESERKAPALARSEALPLPRQETESPASSKGSIQPRQRKKMQVKGKSCFVMLPSIHDNRNPMKAEEIEARMKRFQSHGYDTRGYVEYYKSDTIAEQSGHTQDRAVIPGLTDDHGDKAPAKLQVVFPDLNRWKSHMEAFREAKLAALGVTVGGDSPQESQPLSRQSSSQYRPSQFSPPVPSTSATSNRMSFQGPNLPAAFTPGSSNHTSTRSIASPMSSLGNPRSAMHMHRQSMYASPTMFSQGQPVSPALSGWPQQPFHGQQLSRGASPAHSGSRPAIQDGRSSGSPFSPHGELPGGFGYPGDLLAGVQQRQQHHLQLQQQQQQHLMQQQAKQQALSGVRSPPALEGVPEVDNEGETVDEGLKTPLVKKSEPEIHTPKPGHRHNISVNLERNVHSAGYKLNDYIARDLAEEVSEDSMESSQTNAFGPSIPTDPSLLPVHRPSLQELRSPPSGLSPDLPDRSHSTNELPEPNHVKFSSLAATADSENERDEKDEEKDHATDETRTNPPPGPRHAHMPSHVTSVWSESDSVMESLASQHSEGQKQSNNHSKQSSVSKFNVEAKEFVFNPKSSFNPGIFSPGLSFQPKIVKPFGGSDSPSSALTQTTKFNIGAPSFAPRNGERNGEFSFTSRGPVFKPDAPVFEPSKSFASNSSVTGDENRIFTNLADAVRPPKKSKAVPIVKPVSRGKSAPDEEEDEKEHFDAFDRLSQSDARFKRSKRWDDGDQVPLFAIPSSPPVVAQHQHSISSFQEAIDDIDDSVLDGDKVEHHSETEKAPKNVKETNVAGEDETKTLQEAAILHDSGFQDGSLHSDPSRRLDEAPVDVTEDPVDVTDVREAVQPSLLGHAKQFSLSAAAKPFEFKPFSPTAPAFSPGIARTSVSYQPRTSLGDDHTPIESGNSHLQSPTEVHHPAPALERYIPSTEDEYHPSFNEIDAVMKHMDEEGSDFGVERDEISYVQYTPEKTSAIDVNRADLPPTHFRSDAPSPSPRRVNYQRQYRADDGSNSDSFNDERNAIPYATPIHKLNDAADVPVSDWDDMVSSTEDDKLHARSTFFDSHVEELMNAALTARLDPLTQTLAAIQNSMASFNTSPYPRRGRRVVSSEAIDSDADDEDEDDEIPLDLGRSRSPRKDRRFEKIKNVVLEAIESRTPPVAQASAAPAAPLDLSEIQDAIASVKETMFHLSDVKDVVENVVGEIFERKQASDQDTTALSLKDDGERYANLVNMMNESNSRLLEEKAARSKLEAQQAETQRALKLAEEEVVLLRASAEDDADRYRAHDAEAQHLRSKVAATEIMHDDLKVASSGLKQQVTALEATLEEYRTSSAQWRDEVDALRDEKEALRKTLETFKFQTEEAMRIRENMRDRLNTLRKDMTTAARQMGDEKTKWQRSDDEHCKRYEVLMARLGAEARTRERLEDELERLEKQEREGMKLRVLLEQAQNANAKLEETVDGLRLESAEHQKTADQYAREFREAREAGRNEVQRTRMLMEAQLDAASNEVNIVRADLESEVSRVRAELDHARMEADTAKEKHELVLEEEADTRRDALHEATVKMDATLQEQTARYEQRIADFQQQHQRYLQNALEDKERSEAFLNEKLSLADSKANHLQDKVVLLEERLEVAKSAAQAAIEAAKSAKAPTTAPVEQSTTPRMPEKVSAQALRETIQALQEQLQERETRIETLDKELSEVDQEAPAKLKERETEIGWLRELLGVRVDDISDLINTLADPTFDRESVRDAAIRIRTNLQMEQQVKERIMAGSMAFPSLASISNFATPKAAQLAAAFGNWRKGSQARQFSIASNASTATDSTPSKSLSSAQGFLSGLMTPPASNVRRTPSPNGTVIAHRRGSVRPGSSASAVELRTPRQRGKARMNPPTTPPLMRRDSYDTDAQASSFPSGRFEDDDASSIGGFVHDEKRQPLDEFGPAMGESEADAETYSPAFVSPRRTSHTD
ncbi:hypothetical protein P152DRAFT_453430 [Eremomyces bilateralis CBS 781.70]|uniref:Myosin class II heavy chain n=1 Tax=Eremomyces bilateralis CBS 781.70 TaxID=1392243 RepID=A0A6G1GFB4_9PEZI|nr:uncharacterized protein P152DRAFT_453430 [Eremomyces bilateralis CBS 781.70]KAF1816805.1 hypothetical protein P152DRAFT_453430 [Eremomyces bilateralis CBS 781.70]